MTEEERPLTEEEKKEVELADSFGPVKYWRFNPVNGQPLQRGVQNFKNLFRKPTFSDWVTLIILIIAIAGAYFYYEDTKTCRQTLENLPVICSQYQASETLVNSINKNNSITNHPNFNLSLINGVDDES